MITNSHSKSDNLLDRLRQSWFDLLDRSWADLKLGEKIFDSLVDSYSQDARSYHNLQHVDDLFRLLENIRNSSKDINVLQFSTWFHDYIYDPQDLDNEAKSAVCAAKYLDRLKIDSQTIEAVTEIILSTRKHQPLIEGIDNQIFLDLDLAILGAESNKYQKYAQAIRQEYSYLGDRDYQQGRQKVLTNFLSRERIYFTHNFYQQLESTARKNLQMEINYLNSVDIP